MKRDYINAVKSSRSIPASKKEEIIRDLEEIFAESLAHGESETELSARLGTPEQFASGFENSGAVSNGRKGLLISLAAVFSGVFLGSLGFYVVALLRSTFIWGRDESLAIIGGADGPTQIFVQGSSSGVVWGFVLFGALILVLGALATVLWVKLFRRMR